MDTRLQFVAVSLSDSLNSRAQKLRSASFSKSGKLRCRGAARVLKTIARGAANYAQFHVYPRLLSFPLKKSGKIKFFREKSLKMDLKLLRHN